MKKATLILITLLCILCFAPKSQSEEYDNKVTVLSENMGFSNYLDENDRPAGFNVAIVEEMLRRLDISTSVKMVPWSRGYQAALTEPYVALFSTAHLPERAALFKWVGPLHMVRNSLFSAKPHNEKYTSIEDARRAPRIGAIAHDARQKILVDRGFTNIHELFGSNVNVSLLRMLASGRVDLIISSLGEVTMAALQSDLDADVFSEVVVVDKLYTYIAFSLSTPDDFVQSWQETLDDMKKDGTYEKIMRSYPTGAESIAFNE
ncbi:MAG: ABC transporter substrate-binding protein [Proteobacteria bacterium]|nr:ABC transporter substrate-binding protein [Pseudomonadota bacterium]